MEIPRLSGVKPAPGIAGMRPYSVPKHPAPIDLALDKNEGDAPSEELLKSVFSQGSDVMRRYPDAHTVQMLLAQRFGLDSRHVLVTAGGDDALDRLCRAILAPGRKLVTTNPGFEMLPRYARIMGADVVEVDWPAAQYPTDEVIAAIDDDTALVAIVSPNNPTGSVATRDDIVRISHAKKNAVLLCDFAYIEFADVDPTDFALELSNTIVVRTLSKAWGCAGLRVGYALGPEELIQWMKSSGGPYAISRPSIAIATARLESDRGEMEGFVKQVREDRETIGAALRENGAFVADSHANFVYTRHAKALWISDALAGQGIAIRSYPGDPSLGDSLRITCPGDKAAGERVASAIRKALAPEFLVFTVDGVLADIGQSINHAIQLTAETYGMTFNADDIALARINQPEMTYPELAHWMISYQGVASASLEEVTAKFFELYRGGEHVMGLRSQESLMIPKERLAKMAERFPLAIATTRSREDVDQFLTAAGITDFFKVIVALEDAEPFPSIAPLEMIQEKLGMTRGWLVGDGVREVRAAREAGLVPLGVVNTGERFQNASLNLKKAGAARVLDKLTDLEMLLP